MWTVGQLVDGIDGPHTSSMTGTLIALLLLATVVLVWSATRSAADLARHYGRHACERAGVQWLDQSVHQVRLRVARDHDGRLRLERQFRFEYSDGGQDRHAGLITMLGSQLASLVGPMPRLPEPAP